MKKLLPLAFTLALIPAAVAFKRVMPSPGEAMPSYGRPSALGPENSVPASAEQLARGRQVYEMLCQACHLPTGTGLGNALPPLAGADFLLADRDRAVRVVLHGLSGPITVNGIGYNAAMPPLGSMLTDQQVADVLTYVFNSWGNTGDAFSATRVRQLR